jgi:hypothetical protein
MASDLTSRRRGLTRREFLATAAIGGGVAAGLPGPARAQEPDPDFLVAPTPRLSRLETAREADALTIEWDADSGLAYDINCAWAAADGPRETVIVDAGVPVRIGGLPSDGSFTITIRAKRDGQESAWSAELRAATRPVRPEPPKSGASTMVQGGTRLEWDVRPSVSRNTLGIDRVRVRVGREREDGDIDVLVEVSAVVGDFIDLANFGTARYRLALVSDNPHAPNQVNVSAWSDALVARSSTFSGLKTPTPAEVKQQTPWLMRNYYGLR